MNLLPRFLLALAAGSSLLFTGCGKSEAPANSAAAAPADGVRTVEITANDAMKYSVTEIRAHPGEKLRVTLTNLGHMPKQAMGHNWVLLTPRDDAAVLAFSASVASRLPDYMPEDKSAVLAHTKVLGGGESDSVEFAAPTTAGEYPFLCTFPGHAALMHGKLIVGN
jgi:azurin